MILYLIKQQPGSGLYTMMMMPPVMNQYSGNPGMVNMHGMPGMYYPDYAAYAPMPYAEPQYMYNSSTPQYLFETMPHQMPAQPKKGIYHNETKGATPTRPHHHNGGHVSMQPSPPKKASATR
jgi:hypothetical protein